MRDPYVLLAEAVVLQAVEDYKRLLENNRFRMVHQNEVLTLDELHEFFLSSYFVLLSNLEGLTIVNKLRKEYGYENLPDSMYKRPDTDNRKNCEYLL